MEKLNVSDVEAKHEEKNTKLFHCFWLLTLYDKWISTWSISKMIVGWYENAFLFKRKRFLIHKAMRIIHMSMPTNV